MRVERRYQPIDDIETRAEGSGFRFVGHVAKFNRWSHDLGGFRERIRPGAFRKTAAEGDIRFLLNHDPNFILGRTKAKTVRVAEDSIGLLVEGTAPNTTWARDLHESVQRGDIDQGSFAFRVVGGGESWNHDRTERDLTELALFDVSIVTFPAYEDTNLSARSTFFVQGLTHSLKSGDALDEKDRLALRALLETVAPGNHADEFDEASSRAYLTDLDLRLQHLENMQ